MDSKQPGKSRSTPSADECSQSTGPTSDDGMMSEPFRLTANGESMFLLEASPAKTSRTRDFARVSKGIVRRSGKTSRESWTFYDHRTSSWRTSQRCLFEDLIEFSGTWPRSGTMRSGKAFRRAPLITDRFVIAFSLLQAPLRWSAHRASRRGVTIDLRQRTAGGCRSLEDDLARQGVRGPQSPKWTEWLMGFPVGWTALEPSETPSSPNAPNGSEDDC